MILRLLAFATIAIFTFNSPAIAAKGAKGQKGGGGKGRILMRFDRDHNGVIEGQEATRLQAAYASLAALDTDKNGQLSEAEIAAAKVPVGKKAAGKGAGAAAAKSSTLATPSPDAKPAPAPSGIPGEVK